MACSTCLTHASIRAFEASSSITMMLPQVQYFSKCHKPQRHHNNTHAQHNRRLRGGGCEAKPKRKASERMQMQE
jgi:hypothetical protein